MPALQSVSPELLRTSIQAIGELPSLLTAALEGLNGSQLDEPYREGGWTLRQVAHHVADSHVNAYTRLRLALTEDWPTIRPYREKLWAELPDARSLPVDISLSLLHPLHARWRTLLESLEAEDWQQRGYTHPEDGRKDLANMAVSYAWHGRHHTAHITSLRQRMGW